jgi:hypothetical protein
VLLATGPALSGVLAVALPGRAEGGVIETADVFTTRDGRLVRADGYSPHPDRIAALDFDLPTLLGDGPEASAGQVGSVARAVRRRGFA